ncbi:MAG: amino acid permease [Bacteroidota bacterium]
MSNKQKFGFQAAISVVVANMVGTGVFTSLGFQLIDIQSGFPLMMLWLVGGIIAVCGAITYAELGSALPRSGGEYHFLSEIYHPAAGFVSGWISATVGFAGPTALAALTFGVYLSSVFPSLSQTWLAAGLVVVLSIVHARTHQSSSLVQRLFTGIKVLLIIGFCGAAFFLVENPQPISILPKSGDWAIMLSPAFAVSLIYVSYAFTGWNAATYLTSELDNPQKMLPWILAGGTLLVMMLYLGLNYSFLYAAPIEEMVGKEEVAYVAATHIWESSGANIMGVVLALLLISTVSAMVIAGPRVLQVIGEDYPLFARLGQKNQSGIPAIAIYLQMGISLVFIFMTDIKTILEFFGFTLGLNTLLAVAGIFVVRWKKPDLPRPYRAFAYPISPLIFLVLTGWTLWYVGANSPKAAAIALGIILFGLVVYYFTRRK